MAACPLLRAQCLSSRITELRLHNQLNFTEPKLETARQSLHLIAPRLTLFSPRSTVPLPQSVVARIDGVHPANVLCVRLLPGNEVLTGSGGPGVRGALLAQAASLLPNAPGLNFSPPMRGDKVGRRPWRWHAQGLLLWGPPPLTKAHAPRIACPPHLPA